MTSRDFCFWLQGFFELENPQSISSDKTELIKKHLNLVFKHEIDPSMGDKNHQDELNAIHNSEPEYMSVEWAIKQFGPQPTKKHKFNMHGWYDPNKGILRC